MHRAHSSVCPAAAGTRRRCVPQSMDAEEAGAQEAALRTALQQRQRQQDAERAEREARAAQSLQEKEVGGALRRVGKALPPSAVPNMFPDFNPPPPLDERFLEGGQTAQQQGASAGEGAGEGERGAVSGEGPSQPETYTYRWKRSVLAGVEATPPRAVKKAPRQGPPPAPPQPPEQPLWASLASGAAIFLTFALYAAALGLTLSRGGSLDMQRPVDLDADAQLPAVERQRHGDVAPE